MKLTINIINLACIFLILVAYARASQNEITSHLNDVESDPDMEKYLREAVENFREQMKYGIEAIKMPVLDPLQLQNLDINVQENMAMMSLNIKQVSVSNLSLFNITNLKPNLEHFFIAINLTFPEISVNGRYSVIGKLLKIFPIYGAGNFSINATEVCIAGKGQLQFTNGTIKMALLKLDLLWQHMAVNLENFLGGGDFSDVLQRVVPGVGRDVFLAYRPLILEKLEIALTKKINEKLSDPSIRDVVEGLIPDE